jgi:hypothetical protein
VRRFLIGFGAGVVFGVLLVLGPHPLTDSPWLAPTPSPTPTPILAIVDVEKLDRAQCDAELVQLEISCRLLYTGRPNPPRE